MGSRQGSQPYGLTTQSGMTLASDGSRLAQVRPILDFFGFPIDFFRCSGCLAMVHASGYVQQHPSGPSGAAPH